MNRQLHNLYSKWNFTCCRSLSSSSRRSTSINIVDTPGFKDNQLQGATFDDLCYNYINERVQLLFHDKIFTENQERYIQVCLLVLLLFICSVYQLGSFNIIYGPIRKGFSFVSQSIAMEMVLIWHLLWYNTCFITLWLVSRSWIMLSMTKTGHLIEFCSMV